jgi:outer membrane biosynthesis protein TonB
VKSFSAHQYSSHKLTATIKTMKFISAVVVTLLAISDVAFAKNFANAKKETVLKEDSKYWSRFLEHDSSLTHVQTLPPTPEPTLPPTPEPTLPPTPEPTLPPTPEPTMPPTPGTPSPSGKSCDVTVSPTDDFF